MSRRGARTAVWWLALGYFGSYIPYTALVRVTTSGDHFGPALSATALLPGAAIATAVTMTATIWMLGWWKYAGRRDVLGLTVPMPRRSTLIAGLSFAVIIWTTTIAYSFSGISIVLALLLMRGGVLALAPIVDRISHRRVHWDAWTALGLSFLALGIAFYEVGSYQFTLAAALNLAAYLGGYAFRLREMASEAKSEDPAVNRRFFVEENMVAMAALVGAPALLAVAGTGEVALELRRGFAAALAGPPAGPALLVGVCYGMLALFGTLIYLECSENTFCMVVNRGSSLLSGVVASYVLTLLAGAPLVSGRQLLATAIVFGAITLLATARRWTPTPAPVGQVIVQRIVLFVCGGNTSRSPIAQAICNSTIARRFRIPLETMAGAPIRAMSAGLTAERGAPLSGHAGQALSMLGISGFHHTAIPVTAEMIASADAVYCMTASQRLAVIELCPEAGAKIHRLEPDADIPDPSGAPLDVFVDVANRIERAVQERLASFVPVH
jgi:protein-tyrosine-phosphatase